MNVIIICVNGGMVLLANIMRKLRVINSEIQRADISYIRIIFAVFSGDNIIKRFESEQNDS